LIVKIFRINTSRNSDVIRYLLQVDGLMGASVKVTKDTTSSVTTRSFPSGILSFRNEDSGTEAVHTVVADRDTAGNAYFTFARKKAEDASRHVTPDYVPSADEERRKNDRRQHQVKVVLDTRVASSRRQSQSINEEI
jgi:hypothetical protein